MVLAAQGDYVLSFGAPPCIDEQLQLSVLACNPGNLWQLPGVPHRIKSWSLTSLQAPADEDWRTASQACSVLLAALGREGHLSPKLFDEMRGWLVALRAPAG